MDLFKLGQCVSEIFDFELASVNHMTTSPCSRWPKMHTHHSSNTNMLPEGCLRLCLCAKVHNRHKFNLLHWPMRALDLYRITNQMSSFWHAAPVWSTKLLDIITCYCNIANITHCRIRRFIQQTELKPGFSGMERRKDDLFNPIPLGCSRPKLWYMQNQRGYKDWHPIGGNRVIDVSLMGLLS